MLLRHPNEKQHSLVQHSVLSSLAVIDSMLKTVEGILRYLRVVLKQKTRCGLAQHNMMLLPANVEHVLKALEEF